MNDSTARAERFSVAPSPQPSYIWEVPEKPISVCFPLDIIDRLEHEAVESFRSLSSRGSEVGGVLFGTVEPGSPALITVASYDPVVCDYSRGPLYRLSDIDLHLFSKAMETGSRNGYVPVGFYRSHTRKGLAMDPEDVALLESKFGDFNGIALLIRPFATKPSLGGIFFHENGSIRTESSWLEFPFRASELAGKFGAVQSEPITARPAAPPAPTPKATPRAQIVPIASRREIVTPPPPVFEPHQDISDEPELPAAAAAEVIEARPEPPASESKPPRAPEPPAPTPVAAPVAEPAAPLKREAAPAPAVSEAAVETVPEFAEAVPAGHGSGKVVAISVAAALIVAVLVGLFVYPGFLRRGSRLAAAPPQDTSPLALRVERSGGELVLTWNRDSAAIRNASHAVLAITDGQQHENVDMDLSQLRGAGSISYAPASADVVFRMEVTGTDQTRTTSESVRVLRTRPSPMEEQQAQVQQQQPAAGKQTAPGSAQAATLPQGTPPQEANGQTASAASQEPLVQTPRTPLKRFSTDSLAQRLRPTRPADLPAAPAVPEQAASGGFSGLNLGSPSSAPAPPPPPPAAAQGKPASGGQIQQAQLIRRKDPEYPRLAKEAGARGTVELLVTVGTDGKVKTVKVVKGHPLLQRAAVDAVLQWVYRPTILNGQAVETQTQVFLNFIGDR